MQIIDDMNDWQEFLDQCGGQLKLLRVGLRFRLPQIAKR